MQFDPESNHIDVLLLQCHTTQSRFTRYILNPHPLYILKKLTRTREWNKYDDNQQPNNLKQQQKQSSNQMQRKITIKPKNNNIKKIESR